jgi:hypothetical protein
LSKIEGEGFNFLVKILLPRIFLAYESNTAKDFRLKALQVAEKIIAVVPTEHLKIDIDQFARFIRVIFEADIGQQVLICLRMLKKVLTVNAVDFGLPLKRAGIAYHI